jgi:hypothetical protein
LFKYVIKGGVRHGSSQDVVDWIRILIRTLHCFLGTANQKYMRILKYNLMLKFNLKIKFKKICLLLVVLSILNNFNIKQQAIYTKSKTANYQDAHKIPNEL